MLSSARDLELKRLYHLGKTRRDAMDALSITNTNSMSSASNRLGLHWSWPLANRTNGVAPPEKAARKKQAASRRAKETATVQKLKSQRNGGGKTEPENYDHRPVPAESLDKLLAKVQPTELKGPVLPLHLSPAFPKPEECELSERDLFWIAQMYVRNFGAAQAA